jgi:hypothetical protein
MKTFQRRKTGGCLCGAIRFSVTGYTEAVHCHCRMCRKASGAPFMTWVSLPKSRLRLDCEAPPTYRSSSGAHRSYCAACGSQLFMRYEGEDEVSVAIGTLDDPSEIEVEANIFAKDRLPLVRGFDAEVPDRTEFDDR